MSVTASGLSDPSSKTPGDGNDPMKIEKNIICFAALLIAAVLLVSELRWIYAHPYGDGWDEAYYASQGYRDYSALTSGNFMRFANTMVFGTPERPFAYRVVALPFTFLWGPRIEVMRLSSLACYAGAAILIFLTGRRMAGQQAGIIAAMLFLLSPTVIASSVRFYTEGVTYLAVAALLFSGARVLTAEKLSTLDWIGLGLCSGFGLLTKISFMVMAVLPLLLLYVFTSRQFGIRQSTWFFAKAAVIAAAVSAPWWIKNHAAALMHLRKANNFDPYQLAEFGPVLFWKYSYYFVESNIGFPTAALCLGAVCHYLYKRRKETLRLTAFQKRMLLLCAGCGFVLLVLHLRSVNHCMRLSSPVLIPLSVAASVLFAAYRRQASLLLIAAVLAVQGGLIASSLRFKGVPPKSLWDTGVTRTLALAEQWDWRCLYEIVQAHGIKEPAIGLLGRAAPFNPGNVRYPWAIRGEKVHVSMLPVTIDEDEFLEQSRQFDVLVTIWEHPYADYPRFSEPNAANRAIFETILEKTDFMSESYLTVGRWNETTLRYAIQHTKVKK